MGILIASVAAVLVIGGGIGYANSRGGAEGGEHGGAAVAGGGSFGSSERDELLAMVKERDDTIKNLREKLEEAYEGREIDVSVTNTPRCTLNFVHTSSLLFFII